MAIAICKKIWNIFFAIIYGFILFLPITHDSYSVTENQMQSFSSVTAVAFDPYEELLWTGLGNVWNFFKREKIRLRWPFLLSFQGRLVSYLSPNMERYTAVQAHHSEVTFISLDAHHNNWIDQFYFQIRQILVEEDTIISLAPDNVRCYSRGGLLQLSYRYAKLISS